MRMTMSFRDFFNVQRGELTYKDVREEQRFWDRREKELDRYFYFEALFSVLEERLWI